MSPYISIVQLVLICSYVRGDHQTNAERRLANDDKTKHSYASYNSPEITGNKNAIIDCPLIISCMKTTSEHAESEYHRRMKRCGKYWQLYTQQNSRNPQATVINSRTGLLGVPMKRQGRVNGISNRGFQPIQSVDDEVSKSIHKIEASRGSVGEFATGTQIARNMTSNAPSISMEITPFDDDRETSNTRGAAENSNRSTTNKSRINPTRKGSLRQIFHNLKIIMAGKYKNTVNQTSNLENPEEITDGIGSVQVYRTDVPQRSVMKRLSLKPQGSSFFDILTPPAKIPTTIENSTSVATPLISLSDRHSTSQDSLTSLSIPNLSAGIIQPTFHTHFAPFNLTFPAVGARSRANFHEFKNLHRTSVLPTPIQSIENEMTDLPTSASWYDLLLSTVEDPSPEMSTYNFPTLTMPSTPVPKNSVNSAAVNEPHFNSKNEAYPSIFHINTRKSTKTSTTLIGTPTQHQPAQMSTLTHPFQENGVTLTARPLAFSTANRTTTKPTPTVRSNYRFVVTTSELNQDGYESDGNSEILPTNVQARFETSISPRNTFTASDSLARLTPILDETRSSGFDIAESRFNQNLLKAHIQLIESPGYSKNLTEAFVSPTHTRESIEPVVTSSTADSLHQNYAVSSVSDFPTVVTPLPVVRKTTIDSVNDAANSALSFEEHTVLSASDFPTTTTPSTRVLKTLANSVSDAVKSALNIKLQMPIRDSSIGLPDNPGNSTQQFATKEVLEFPTPHSTSETILESTVISAIPTASNEDVRVSTSSFSRDTMLKTDARIPEQKSLARTHGQAPFNSTQPNIMFASRVLQRDDLKDHPISSLTEEEPKSEMSKHFDQLGRLFNIANDSTRLRSTKDINRRPTHRPMTVYNRFTIPVLQASTQTTAKPQDIVGQEKVSQNSLDAELFTSNTSHVDYDMRSTVEVDPNFTSALKYTLGVFNPKWASNTLTRKSPQLEIAFDSTTVLSRLNGETHDTRKLDSLQSTTVAEPSTTWRADGELNGETQSNRHMNPLQSAALPMSSIYATEPQMYPIPNKSVTSDIRNIDLTVHFPPEDHAVSSLHPQEYSPSGIGFSPAQSFIHVTGNSAADVPVVVSQGSAAKDRDLEPRILLPPMNPNDNWRMNDNYYSNFEHDQEANERRTNEVHQSSFESETRPRAEEFRADLSAEANTNGSDILDALDLKLPNANNSQNASIYSASLGELLANTTGVSKSWWNSTRELNPESAFTSHRTSKPCRNIFVIGESNEELLQAILNSLSTNKDDANSSSSAELEIFEMDPKVYRSNKRDLKNQQQFPKMNSTVSKSFAHAEPKASLDSDEKLLRRYFSFVDPEVLQNFVNVYKQYQPAATLTRSRSSNTKRSKSVSRRKTADLDNPITNTIRELIRARNFISKALTRQNTPNPRLYD